jgi:hypothetical protein
MSETKKSVTKITTRMIIGFSILVLGIVMILAWWPDVVSFFRGILGMLFAGSGLLVLYSLNK